MNSMLSQKIKADVEKLGSFFSLFKKGKLKKSIFLSLEELESDLHTIPDLKASIEEQSKQHQETLKNFESHKIKAEQEYQTLEQAFEQHKKKQLLISKLLSSKSTNKGFENYKRILNNDFMDFANDEESLANEAEAILKLQAIEKELEVITAYPKLHKKTTIAIGGGFSAGKSEFISSFFSKEIKLPIGIEPTTAIPTYVMSNEIDEIIGCSHNSGVVDLKEIDDTFHSKISHDFIKSFDFNLKEIMPIMVLGTQFEHEHICFIDTPGYNPAANDKAYTQDDVNTAKEFLNNASTLIWLIDIKNGGIPLSDLDFLDKLEIENQKFYVVLNKADSKDPSDIEKILDEIKEVLNGEGIDFEGISAFSSTQKKEYVFRGNPLFDFIEKCNTESKVHEEIVKKLYEVYSMYKRAILTNKIEKEAIKRELHSISLDMLEEGYDDFTKPAFQRIDNLKKVFDTKKQEENLKRLDDNIIKLKNAIDEVFENESSIDFDDIKEQEIEIDFGIAQSDEEKDDAGNMKKRAVSGFLETLLKCKNVIV